MAMYFEDVGNGQKRKWQCFVCGKGYDDYLPYKEHIIEEHEQGREYIRCPDCDAPVRDMPTHYKVKHPKRIMPKGIQTKVTVWKDFKPGGNKPKKTRKPTCRKGEFPSKKNGCDIPYRSGMEEEFYNLLEEDVDVESFFAEPFKVPYYFNGKWHDYIPDIRVNFVDGSTEIWEVKPATQTGPEYEQNQTKWASMNDHANNMGWTFVVQTEVGLGKLKKKISRQRQSILTD